MSREEFTDFYVGAKDRCLRAAVASGIDPARAEDAVAEAFARAWSRWRTVRTARSPAAWVLRTAVNADISWWRKHRRETTVNTVPEAPHLAEDAESATVLLTSVRRLPPRQRQVVVLRYYLDLDTQTIADSLGIARGTVSANLHHALTSLREHLADLDRSAS